MIKLILHVLLGVQLPTRNDVLRFECVSMCSRSFHWLHPRKSLCSSSWSVRSALLSFLSAVAALFFFLFFSSSRNSPPLEIQTKSKSKIWGDVSVCGLVPLDHHMTGRNRRITGNFNSGAAFAIKRVFPFVLVSAQPGPTRSY